MEDRIVNYLFDCPRCFGAGRYELDGETCVECGRTGKLTPEGWQSYCEQECGGRLSLEDAIRQFDAMNLEIHNADQITNNEKPNDP